MKEKILLVILRNLEPSGLDGFEGLIAKLLTSLNGIRFILAASGAQHGKDMISTGDDGIHIAIECKRYKDKTSLSITELLGKISEAYQQTPYLDIWTLVLSKPLESQLYEKLMTEGERRGLKISIIETNDGEPSSLEVLCASHDDILLKHINNNQPKNIDPGWEIKLSKELEEIRGHSGYQDVLSRLKLDFNKFEVGYVIWRDEQNNWLKNNFRSETKSRGAFGQVICIDDKFIERKSVTKELDNWIKDWHQEKTPFVLLGEEGDGKTWAAASWIKNYIESKNDLPILFLNSQMIESTDIVEVLAKTIKQQLKKYTQQYWERKINNWKHRNYDSKPFFVLIIDGLNENHLFKWRELFEKIIAEEWDKKVALGFITRKKHWEMKFGNISHLKMKEFILAPFNDEELKIAIKKHNLKFDDLPNELKPLARKPRYLDLIIKHRKKMEDSGDITVQRLLYEDFKDRINRRNHNNLTDRDFSEIMKGLAENFHESSGAFSIKDLSNIAPLANQNDIYMELITSGVFEDTSSKAGKFTVEPKRLAHGLGLILLDDIKNLHEKNESTIEDCISKFLEPQPEIYFKTNIIDAMVFHAMNQTKTLEIIGITLLKYWSTSKNKNTDFDKNFQAYFSCNPQIYFSFAESVYLQEDRINSHWVKYSLEDTFTYWIENSEKQRDIIKSKFEKWMGYISIDSQEKLRNDQIKNKIGFVPSYGEFKFQGYFLTSVINPDLLGIRSMVLSIVSRSGHNDFIRALIIGYLTEEIKFFPDHLPKYQWILRINHEYFWPHIIKEINILLDKNNPITNLVAFNLMSLDGSAEALQLRSELIRKKLSGINEHIEYTKEVSRQYISCNRENYLEYAEMKNVHPHIIAKSLSHLALEPDLPEPPELKNILISILNTTDIKKLWSREEGYNEESYFIKDAESTLCAFSPFDYKDLIKSIIKDSANRKNGILGLCTHQLKEYFLIFGKQDYELIERAWTEIFKKKELSKFEEQNEANLFLFVLINSTAREQFSYLINRSEELIDLYSFDEFFKPLSDSSIDYVLSKINLFKHIKKPWRILSFLAQHPKKISLKILQKIGDIFEDETYNVRAAVFKIAAKTENINLIKLFLDSNWKCQELSNENNFSMREANYWGSVILSFFGNQQPFTEIKKRICPYFLGEAIYQRGERKEDIEECLKNLFVVKYAPFQEELIKYVHQLYPDYLDKLLHKILKESQEIDKEIYNNSSFYKKLCSFLLKNDLQKGIKLYERIKKVKGTPRYIETNTGIESLTYDLFRADRVPELEKLWELELDSCFTDSSLFEFILVNQKVDNSSWLEEQIKQRIDSSVLCEKARGIMLLGFLDAKRASTELDALFKATPESWIRNVIKVAIKNWKYNQWSKTWFSRFIESDDDVKAWAYFRLFLKCVDRRFWLWHEEVFNGSKKSFYNKKKENFYKLNNETIKKRIEENEKELKTNFLGTKIIKGNFGPW